MYRIFCESYKNYINSFDDDNWRLRMSESIGLLTDENKYREEENKKSEIYIKASALLYYMQQNIDRFPKLKAFLWTLESRNMKGKQNNSIDKNDLEEQTKLINSFLKLTYWY